jgi:hypothetical protein
VNLDGFHELVMSLGRVRHTTAGGPSRWQHHGRLLAREVDATHVVVRVPFDVRDVLLSQHPDVFSVPPRFTKHMMVVADLAIGDDDAIEDAVTAAWRMQAEIADLDRATREPQEQD